MWPHYGTDTEMYGWLSHMNTLRKAHGLAHGGKDALSLASVIDVVRCCLALLCFHLCFPFAFVAKTVPFLAVLRCRPRSIV